MEDMPTTESLIAEIEELRSALTTVTEALILFQEYIEGEIGEMSYFRDSGSFYKLVETLNKIRRNRRSAKLTNGSSIKQSSIQYSYRQSTGMGSQVDTEEEEEVEVDVDYSDDDPVDEITISQVFSVPSPEKSSAEALLKINKSAITITPVYPDEKKMEQQAVIHPQSAVLIPLDKSQNPASKFVSADATGTQLLVVDHQRLINTAVCNAMKQETKEKETFVGNIDNNNGSSVGASSSGAGMLPNLKKPKKGGGKKKSLLKTKNISLKKKLGRPKGSTKSTGFVTSKKGAPKRTLANNGVDEPLDLQKKARRPSERPVKCSFCGKCYSSKGVMSRHIKEAHQKEPQFSCFYCNEKFRNGPARLEHMNSSHPEDMNSITCPYCHRSSTTVAGKRNHMMLCARKYFGTNTPKSSTTGSATSPTDSGLDLEASLSG